MKNKLTCLLYILLFTCYSWGQVNTNIRKSIIPLHSTRSDVEKLATLVSNIGGNYKYETDNETFDVYYSKDKCIWHGWNVKPDVVISYRVYPKTPTEFDSVLKNSGQLIKTRDDASSIYYTNVAEGIQYAVDQIDMIHSISYFPSEKDSALRCKGFPKYNPVSITYAPYRSFKVKSISDWDIGLVGGVLAQVKKSVEFKGYIFIYGKKEEKVKLNKLRKDIEYFAYKVVKSSPKKVKVAFGGFRDKTEIETFLLPNEYIAPTASPKYPL